MQKYELSSTQWFSWFIHVTVAILKFKREKVYQPIWGFPHLCTAYVAFVSFWIVYKWSTQISGKSSKKNQKLSLGDVHDTFICI